MKDNWNILDTASHIFVDIDWVLVSSVWFYWKLIRDTMVELWATGLPDDNRFFVWSDHREYLLEYLPKSAYRDACVLLEQTIRNSKDHKPDLVPWAIDFLAKVKHEGKTLAAITSRSRPEIDWLFCHYPELKSKFQKSISRDDVDNMKPHPEPILNALEYYSVGKDDAIFIWDSMHDYHSANWAWVSFYWVCTWVMTSEEWKDIWVHHFCSIKDILFFCEK